MLNLEALPRDFFPTFNAAMNGTASLLLLVGFILIKQRKITAHLRVMWCAFGASALFLASYLYYHFNFHSNAFGGEGIIRPIYFAMLITHIILAVVILPFIFRLLYLGTRGFNERHRRLAKWIWPLWMYTSMTGVLIYFMLYQWYPRLPLNGERL